MGGNHLQNYIDPSCTIVEKSFQPTDIPVEIDWQVTKSRVHSPTPTSRRELTAHDTAHDTTPTS